MRCCSRLTASPSSVRSAQQLYTGLYSVCLSVCLCKTTCGWQVRGSPRINSDVTSKHLSTCNFVSVKFIPSFVAFCESWPGHCLPVEYPAVLQSVTFSPSVWWQIVIVIMCPADRLGTWSLDCNVVDGNVSLRWKDSFWGAVYCLHDTVTCRSYCWQQMSLDNYTVSPQKNMWLHFLQ